MKTTNKPVNKLPADQNPTATASPSLSTTSASDRLGNPPVQQTGVEESIVSAAAIYLYRQSRFQPISYLTPEVLSGQLSEWNVGTMRRFSLTMDAIENRDCVVKSATGKLKQSLSRRPIDIVKIEGADEATSEAHATALRDFYANVECTNAIDRNLRGGSGTLVYEMMDSALKKYAPFEIIWRPIGPDRLTATFVHVPLWFFENRTGSLRFCGNFAWDGIPLRDGEWMVCVGDGIMEAITVAWMYKTMSLRDWVVYSERNGMTVPVGHTPHAKGSTGHNAVMDALQAIGTGAAVVLGEADTLDKVDFGSAGQLPYPPLVEYMDKCISALARGADLSTISSGMSAEGRGASLQGDESDLVEEHYGQVISETLNHYVDKKVIEWHFGEGTEPLAYAKINVPKPKNLQVELAVDEFLASAGVKLGTANAVERYGRSEASEEEINDDKVLKPAAPKPSTFGQPGQGEEGQEGEQLGQAAKFSRQMLDKAQQRIAQNAVNGTKTLVKRIKETLAINGDKEFLAALKGLRHELPKLAANVERTPANADVLLDVAETLHNPLLKR